MKRKVRARDNGSLDVHVGQAADVKFGRVKRETVSVLGLDAKVKTFDSKVAESIAAMEKQLKETTDGAMAALAAVARDSSKESAATVKKNLDDMRAALDKAVGAMKKDVADASAGMDKELTALGEARKKERAQVAAMDATLKGVVAAKEKEKGCAAKGEIYDGTACAGAAGTTAQHPSETMTVACNKDYSHGPVCVLTKDFRKNDHPANDGALFCAKQPHGRMCSSAEIQYLCQKGKFKGKSIRSFVWTRGAEGDGNRENTGVYVNSGNCANDDWNRDQGSGATICCRDKEINIGYVQCAWFGGVWVRAEHSAGGVARS